jgi:hypothetical protein
MAEAIISVGRYHDAEALQISVRILHAIITFNLSELSDSSDVVF